MSRARKQRQLYLLVGIIAPGVAVLGIRFAGSGAADAHAEPSTVESASLPNILSSAPEPTPEVTRMLEHTRKLNHDHGVPSPFELATVVIAGSDGSGSASARSGTLESGLRISAILRQPDQIFAVIDDTTYTLGDEVQSGWFLDDIESTSNLVRLRHTSGATETHAIHEFD